MQCANPQCRQDARDLQSGTLRLLEMEVTPEERVKGSDFGFPVCTVVTRYFWLCDACSRILRLVRWTSSGLILEARSQFGIETTSSRRTRMLPYEDKLTTGIKASFNQVA